MTGRAITRGTTIGSGRSHTRARSPALDSNAYLVTEAIHPTSLSPARVVHWRVYHENRYSVLVNEDGVFDDGVIEPTTASIAEDGFACAALVAQCATNRVAWLIDNAEAYGALLESLRGARRSVHIAQLAFDADCAAYSRDSPTGAPPRDAVIAEMLAELATGHAPEIRILLNATWVLDTARPLRKYFRSRGISTDRIEVRGMSRFPHFMHAKLVLIDGRQAFLLGSPFVNSYWDDGSHIPFDARRPLRELGGRPLHDVSMRLRGPVVGDLEAVFAKLWRACGDTEAGVQRPELPASVTSAPRRTPGMRVVCDAPDGLVPDSRNGSMHMLGELLEGIARARCFIYIEHQYLTSRPIVAALVEALHRAPALEIIIVLNQNPDLTAYRGWQNTQLDEGALLRHPRVGVFTLWSTAAHLDSAHVTRISQLFIHSKVIVIDDVWAAAGTSNLDGVSMGDYGADFAGALGQRVFRGVRNVEVNVVIDADEANGPDAESIVTLRERLWSEHLGVSARALDLGTRGRWLAVWREAARANVRTLSSGSGEELARTHPARAPHMVGRLLPYSDRAHPRQQLGDVGVDIDPQRLELCYNPTWLSVYLCPHWIRNIF
jgi:phosphatidylserine/phosphatidylglycerophosphate/cardiolipin synthase-like enzyme